MSPRKKKRRSGGAGVFLADIVIKTYDDTAQIADLGIKEAAGTTLPP
jgi:hypothetical protein